MSAAKVFRPGATALITGGASGVGLAVAHLCRRHGMRVIIVDRNTENLNLAKETLAKVGEGGGGDGAVEAHDVDVSNREHWERLRGAVGNVDFLMLNAGVGYKGDWGDADYFDKILSTNFYGVLNGLNAYVPHMRNNTAPTAVVITGSKQGITNPPGNAAYNASKSAVKTLAEHLSYDVRGNPNVSVHLLVPGWTYTGLTTGNKAGLEPDSEEGKPPGAWTPGQVARFLEKKMEQGAFYVLCPDNDVGELTDRKRMLWAVGDLVHGRPPLSRWREEWKAEAEAWMDAVDVSKF